MYNNGRRHSCAPVMITGRKKSDADDIYAEGRDRSRRRSHNRDEILCENRAIKQFAQNVDLMNEAVLLPSKLQDIRVDANAGCIPANTNLYQYYHMLNTAKHELFNGCVSINSKEKSQEISANENKIEYIRNSLVNHLQSLYEMLNQFSNAALYIANLYQSELEKMPFNVENN